MALNSRTLQLVILAVLLAAFYLDLSTADVRRMAGGYQPIKKLNDPIVQEIAQFAVDQHNKDAKMLLRYEKVVKGESQVVSGTNYKLVILATDAEDFSRQYEAIVWDKPWLKFRQLTSFIQLNRL